MYVCGIMSDQAKMVLEPVVYAAYKQCQATGKAMDKAMGNSLARALMGWAQSKGCVSFAHWFSPMRGANGEKVSVKGSGVYVYVLTSFLFLSAPISVKRFLTSFGCTCVCVILHHSATTSSI
jgi:glutamine synthetase type III